MKSCKAGRWQGYFRAPDGSELGISMASRISRDITTTQTATEKRSAPPMIQTVEAAVPRKSMHAKESNPTQAKHEKARTINNLDGRNEVINNH